MISAVSMPEVMGAASLMFGFLSTSAYCEGYRLAGRLALSGVIVTSVLALTV